MTPAQVLARLKATARDAGPRGIDPYYGAGILDATNALGGGYAADLALPAAGANEPDDVPSRATALAGTATGTLAIEGDVDWYRYDSPNLKDMLVQVSPPTLDPNRPQNVDLVLSVYDPDLSLVSEVDQNGEGKGESLTVRMRAGTYYLAVRNRNGSRVGDRPYTLTVQRGRAGVLAPATPVPTGASYAPVAVGDLDGDGRSDVAAGVVQGTGTGQLHVLRQRPGGGLGTATAYATTESSLVRNIVISDLDGDGLQDVVVSTAVGVQVFRQTPGHTLAAPEVVPDTTGTTVVAVADLDGDGRADLVQSTDTELALLRAQPDGSWTRTVADTAGGASTIAVGDLDGDGRPDVAAEVGSTIQVLHNAATGWTTTSHVVGGSWPAGGITVADVNGDGRADLATVTGGNSPASSLRVWRQSADGTLPASPTVMAMPDIPQALAAADVTGDGLQDLVAAHGGWQTVSVVQQRADGTLLPASTSIANSPSHYDDTGIALADLTGDGRIDAVAPSGSGLDLLANAGGPTPTGAPLFVRSTWPADFGSGLPITTAPTVTFVRDAVPSTVSASTVRLVDGRTGAAVPATVSYDAARRTATVKPSTVLYDGAPYRLNVSGVKDTLSASMTTAYSSTFRTVDTAPPPVGAFRASGALRAATLTWTAPHLNDLDRYVVRMAAGTTPPATVTSGANAYSGTATKATVSLAQGTTYSFRIWVKDRTGHYSASSWGRTVGTAASMTSNVTTVRKGYAVTLSGRVVRRDTGKGVAGATMQLYWRQVGTSTWKLTTTRTSSSTGAFSYAHRPAVSVDYMWVYRGSSALVGSSSALRRVTVR